MSLEELPLVEPPEDEPLVLPVAPVDPDPLVVLLVSAPLVPVVLVEGVVDELEDMSDDVLVELDPIVSVLLRVSREQPAPSASIASKAETALSLSVFLCMIFLPCLVAVPAGCSGRPALRREEPGCVSFRCSRFALRVCAEGPAP